MKLDVSTILDKGLAYTFCNEQEIEKACTYLNKYIESLNKLIEKDEANEILKQEIIDTQSEFAKMCEKNADELFANKKYLKAIMFYQKTLEAKDLDEKITKNLGIAFKELKQGTYAEEFLLKYEKLANDKEESYRLLGDVYACLNINMPLAIEYYEKYIKTNKLNASVYNMLGHLYSTLYKYDYIDKQVDYFKKAYALSQTKTIMGNLVIALAKTNDTEETLNIYKHLLSLKPREDDYFSYACFCIKHKNFTDGFKAYLHRFKRENDAIAYPTLTKPKWNGKYNLSQATLLIHYEQGFGDVIMFSRYVKQINKLAKRTIFVVQNELEHLFKDSDFGCEICTNLANVHDMTFDYHVPLLDLPYILKIQSNNIFMKDGYLDVNTQKVEEFKNLYFNNDKVKIGIAYAGHKNLKKLERDVPLSFFTEIAKLPSVELYSLQLDTPEEEFKNLPEGVNIINFAPHIKTFQDTAAAMKNFDFVISTDNTLLNLAGALGIKTFGLFNFHNEYRWFNLNDGDAGWYSSIKPIVAPKHNDWNALGKILYDEVKKILA